MVIKVSKDNIFSSIRHIAIYLLLLMCSGFYVYTQGYRIPVTVVVSLICFCYSGFSINIRVLGSLFAMILISMLSGAVNNDSTQLIVETCADIVSAALIAFGAVKEKQKAQFLNAYRRVILLIALFSTVVYIVGAAANDAFSVFPVVSQNEHDAYFVGFSFVYKMREYLQYRNLGLFWEPGAFQTYILLAMILEDAMPSRHPIRNLAILSVAMLTTASTTGILCLALFWLVYVLKREKKSSSFIVALLLLSGGIVVVMYPELLPEELRFGLVDKVNDVFGGSAELETTQTRLDSIRYPLNAFLENPLLGIGRGGMLSWSDITGHKMNTCTPINWFAHYGVIMGTIIMFGFGRFFWRSKAKKWVGLAFFAIFLISISTEAFNYNPTLLCLAFMGIGETTRQNDYPEVLA